MWVLSDPVWVTSVITYLFGKESIWLFCSGHGCVLLQPSPLDGVTCTGCWGVCRVFVTTQNTRSAQPAQTLKDISTGVEFRAVTQEHMNTYFKDSTTDNARGMRLGCGPGQQVFSLHFRNQDPHGVLLDPQRIPVLGSGGTSLGNLKCPSDWCCLPPGAHRIPKKHQAGYAISSESTLECQRLPCLSSEISWDALILPTAQSTEGACIPFSQEESEETCQYHRGNKRWCRNRSPGVGVHHPINTCSCCLSNSNL